MFCTCSRNCSKAAALELTNISVEMKVAIEQLREQVQNIE